jgi:hypothetical protein
LNDHPKEMAGVVVRGRASRLENPNRQSDEVNFVEDAIKLTSGLGIYLRDRAHGKEIGNRLMDRLSTNHRPIATKGYGGKGVAIGDGAKKDLERFGIGAGMYGAIQRVTTESAIAQKHCLDLLKHQKTWTRKDCKIKGVGNERLAKAMTEAMEEYKTDIESTYDCVEWRKDTGWRKIENKVLPGLNRLPQSSPWDKTRQAHNDNYRLQWSKRRDRQILVEATNNGTSPLVVANDGGYYLELLDGIKRGENENRVATACTVLFKAPRKGFRDEEWKNEKAEPLVIRIKRLPERIGTTEVTNAQA